MGGRFSKRNSSINRPRSVASSGESRTGSSNHHNNPVTAAISRLPSMIRINHGPNIGAGGGGGGKSSAKKYGFITDNYHTLDEKISGGPNTGGGGGKSSAKKKYGFIPYNYHTLEEKASDGPNTGGGGGGGGGKSSAKKKYAFIPDNYRTPEEVTEALRTAGLESSNLIIGIDFTKSNEWTGKNSFNNRSLHAIGDTPNPYEKAISIIGNTLSPFDEDNLIPCFGFGDGTTNDQEVFSFHNDHTPCYGFEEVLSCYKKLVPNLRLVGPTSYAPVVEAAIDIVEKSGGQYHILVLITDGQVTRSVNTSEKELSPQEEQTIKSIVNASSYPLSIVLVGVGDGPWEDMKNFDDKIPAREFDNFQFVNFTAIMSKNVSPSEKETAFALAALMEIPSQYQAARYLGILGRVTGRAKKIVPRPPPVLYSRQEADERNQAVCPICVMNAKDLAFGCGHVTCQDCGATLSNCPICRQPIRNRLRLFIN